MKNYKDLYNHLFQLENGDALRKWIDIPWKGKDKLECVTRLFFHFGLIKN